MTFQHMVTYQVIVLRVIKHVQYAKKTLILNNWNMEERQYIFGIEGFLEVIILTGGWKKAFNGNQEASGPPTPLTSVEVYEKVNSIDHTFGK